MSVVKRLLAFVFAFIALYFVACIVIGVSCATAAAAHAPTAAQRTVASLHAVVGVVRLQILVAAACLLTAALLAFGFRVLTFCVAGAVALWLVVWQQPLQRARAARLEAAFSRIEKGEPVSEGQIPAALMRLMPRPAAEAVASPAPQGAGSSDPSAGTPSLAPNTNATKVMLKTQVTVQVHYGKATLQAGTVLDVVSWDKENVAVKTIDGTVCSIPVNAVQAQ